VSAKQKIQRVLTIYNSAAAQTVRQKSGVSVPDLEQAAMWSHKIREARNALHWTAGAPSIPNSYEKVAVLLMAAGPNLKILNRIRMAC